MENVEKAEEIVEVPEGQYETKERRNEIWKTRPGPKKFEVTIKTRTWKKIKPHSGSTQLKKPWTGLAVLAVCFHSSISM